MPDGSVVATDPVKRTARLAGFLYLVSSIVGVVGLVYAPSTLIVRGDATATASHIIAAQPLFRIGLASELIGMTMFVFVALTLYRLFKGVNASLASLMVILYLLSVPISLFNVLNGTVALRFLTDAHLASVFEKAQLDGLAFVFIGLHSQGFDLAEVFWGIWLIPFGLLVYRSGFIPRAFGILLIVACFGYLADSILTTLLLPQYEALLSRVGRIVAAGELPIIFWLLIWGVKAPRREQLVPHDSAATP
jgi:uncharacterized protein DUF4386